MITVNLNKESSSNKNTKKEMTIFCNFDCDAAPRRANAVGKKDLSHTAEFGSLTYGFLDNTTSVVRVRSLERFCSDATEQECVVYGLRADEGFPEEMCGGNYFGNFLNHNANKYLAYIGLSKESVRTKYGLVRFVLFTHAVYEEDEWSSLPLYLMDRYKTGKTEMMIERGTLQQDDTVDIFPKVIKEYAIDWWLNIFSNWEVETIDDILDLMDDYDIHDHVDWSELLNHLEHHQLSDAGENTSESETGTDEDAESVVESCDDQGSIHDSGTGDTDYEPGSDLGEESNESEYTDVSDDESIASNSTTYSDQRDVHFISRQRV